MTENNPIEAAQPLFDRPLWLILLSSLISLSLYVFLSAVAFPSVDVPIRISRWESQKLVEKLASANGISLKQPIVSSIFTVDSVVKQFIEREYSAEQAKQLLKDVIPVWFWNTRMCAEHQPEEFSTVLSTEGSLIQLIVTLPPEFKGVSVDHEQAQNIARSFVTQHTSDAWDFKRLISDGSSDTTNFRTYFFMWEDDSRDYHGARMRIVVSVSGGKVVYFNKYLSVPENWSTNFVKKQAPKFMLGTLAGVFDQLLHMAVLVVACWAVLTRNIRWPVAICGGAVLASLAFLNSLNNFPLLLHDYSPLISYRRFLLDNLANLGSRFILDLFNGAALFASSEVIYRKCFAHHVAISELFNLRGLSERQVLRSLLTGGFLFLIGLGWIALYYFYGQWIGVWSPLRSDYQDGLSSFFPGFSAIAECTKTAASEELVNRVLGLGLGLLVFRNFWLANLVQALVWALGHSSYPQEPVWARIFELLVVGLLQGWALRRYGILACFFQHYLFNAYLYMRPLLFCGNIYLSLSSSLAFSPYLVFTVLAIILFYRARIKEIVAPLRNADLPLHAPVADSKRLSGLVNSCFSISLFSKILMLTVCLLCLFCRFDSPLRSLVGADSRLDYSRKQALDSARRKMEEHQLKPSSWMSVVSCSYSVNGNSLQFVREKNGQDFARRYFMDTGGGFWWNVRFFKPEQEEQYDVGMNGLGESLYFHRYIEEEQEGERFTEEEALESARKYLSASLPHLCPVSSGSVSQSSRPHRKDYSVSFVSPKLQVGESPYRATVYFKGSQVSGRSCYLEVPQKWSYERAKERDFDEILSLLRRVVSLLKSAIYFLWCIHMLRYGRLEFRPAAAIALVFLSGMLSKNLSLLPQFFFDYVSSVPLNSFIVQSVLREFDSLLECTVRTCIYIAFCLAALLELVPQSPLSAFLQKLFLRQPFSAAKAKERFVIVGNAVLIAFGALATKELLNWLTMQLYVFFSPSVLYVQSAPFRLVELANSEFPLLTVVAETLSRSLQEAGLLIATCYILVKFCRSKLISLAVVLAYVLIVHSGARSLADYTIGVGSQVCLYLVCFFFITRIARDNYLAYLLYFYLEELSLAGEAIARYSPSIFSFELVIIRLLLMLPIVCAVLLWLRTRTLTEENKDIVA